MKSTSAAGVFPSNVQPVSTAMEPMATPLASNTTSLSARAVNSGEGIGTGDYGGIGIGAGLLVTGGAYMAGVISSGAVCIYKHSRNACRVFNTMTFGQGKRSAAVATVLSGKSAEYGMQLTNEGTSTKDSAD